MILEHKAEQFLYIMGGRKAVRLDFRWSARPVFITCDNPREVADAFEQRKRSSHKTLLQDDINTTR
jgi:hypothetical protein